MNAKMTSKIVRTILEHQIDEEQTKYELEMTGQIICKCGDWKQGFVHHADHVANMVLNAIEEVENQ